MKIQTQFILKAIQKKVCEKGSATKTLVFCIYMHAQASKCLCFCIRECAYMCCEKEYTVCQDIYVCVYIYIDTVDQEDYQCWGGEQIPC